MGGEVIVTNVNSRIDRAIESGLAFLEVTQTPDGELPTFTSLQPDMGGELSPDPCVFPAALAAYALGFVPGGAPIIERTLRFLVEQRSPTGVWHHWRREHVGFATVPPDIDDTSCISMLLNRCGVPGAAHPRILLDNRNRRGLFYTWFLPRRRLTSRPHRRIMLDQWRIIRRQGEYFGGMACEADDVDAVVNANCLYALGRFRGDGVVIEYLMDVLRTGIESQCDKYYDDPFAVWYFFSRALSGRVPGAAELIAERIASITPESAHDLALSIASLIACNQQPSRDSVARLLDAQLASGGWPCGAIYSGGRHRGPEGRFDRPFPPGTPFWGSHGLTTAFCLQALAQSQERGWQAAEGTPISAFSSS